MKKLDKKYNFKEVEKKWQKYWQDNNIYNFDWKDADVNNVFSIDTPPPTVSGTLHMGHIFSYSQGDFIARYQRMSGKNVFYPIGFDDNGLPTERYIEKLKGIKGKELPRNEFIDICKDNVHIAEDQFEDLFKSVSFSFDWSAKYQTISNKSKTISQLRTEAYRYTPYMAYQGGGHIYNGTNIDDQLNYLQMEIEHAIAVIKEAN